VEGEILFKLVSFVSLKKFIKESREIGFDVFYPSK